MGWEKSSDRWLKGRIEPQEAKEDVLGWLESDPMWKKATKVTVSRESGSHCATIHIRHIGMVLPNWSGDVFQISTVSGRWVKKWIVAELVKAYEQLADL